MPFLLKSQRSHAVKVSDNRPFLSFRLIYTPPPSGLYVFPSLFLFLFLSVFPCGRGISFHFIPSPAPQSPPHKLRSPHLTNQSINPPLRSTAPTSFCKCTCFSNSTIIPLDAPRPNNLRPSISPRWAEFSRPGDLPQLPLRLQLQERDAAAAAAAAAVDKQKREDRKEFRKGNCNDCNRQYCMDAHLPICKGAKVEDVFTTCFRMSGGFFFFFF